jgi:hypothetical protein
MYGGVAGETTPPMPILYARQWVSNRGQISLRLRQHVIFSGLTANQPALKTEIVKRTLLWCRMPY